MTTSLLNYREYWTTQPEFMSGYTGIENPYATLEEDEYEEDEEDEYDEYEEDEDELDEEDEE